VAQVPPPARPDTLTERFEAVDLRITRTLARLGVPVLRVGLGIVFLWFGLLKFFPDQSPAAELATRTIEELSFGIISPAVALPMLAVWETLIGLGLITGRALRATLLLLIVQMAGTLTPLVLFPDEAFTTFPLVPTLEGQYIIKNVVIIGAAMVVGATVRGGRLVSEGPGADAVGGPADHASRR
jgi:uncharacterized membrane protein YphA (DoxX/SURF4 family)